MSSLRVDFHGEFTTDEGRLRDLELGFAKFFGNPAAASKYGPMDGTDQRIARYETAQYQQRPQVYAQSEVPRVPVVTKKFVEMFGLRPCATPGYRVLGEDGQAYCVDDVLRVMVLIHTGEIRNPAVYENKGVR